MMLTDAMEQFQRAIEAEGLTPPDCILADGQLHRFASNGNRDDDAGWYTFFSDGVPAGVFGCWRADLKRTWCGKSDRQMTEEELATYRTRIETSRREREEEEAHRHAAAAGEARRIWDRAKSAQGDHPYLQRKQIRPHGLRCTEDGRLIVPVSIDGAISSLQFIGPDGGKKFLFGGEIRGGFFSIGEPCDDATILVAEGYATGASLYEATGSPVIVALNAGNLLPVARTLRAKFPHAQLIVCGDHDQTGIGQAKATEVAAAVSAKVVIPSDAGMDWNDLLVRDGREAVKTTVEAALRASSTSAEGGGEEGDVMRCGVDSGDDTSRAARDGESPAAPEPVHDDPWPILDPLAFRGVLGDLVHAIEPHSEADPAALLIQSLAAFGNVLNRAPHFRAEADSHHMNLFAALVGETSKGRKGTSWGHIRRVFALIDPDWTDARVLAGLSSGEGLIWAVRDEIAKDEPVREKGRPTGEYQRVVSDRGVEDKRLLVLESEFASTLRVISREGNTLSAVIRQAWDSGDLRTMTKNSPAQATGAHVSVLGHITKDELCRLIEATDASNGFLNRFLWVCVRRSKALPEGGRLDDAVLAPFVRRLHEAVQFGRETGKLTRDQHARAIWHDVYADLSEGKPGLLGAVISRGEAQVMRLACLYALQDLSAIVRSEHLMAALALWEFCEASARYIFGKRLGDPIADELLSALQKHPGGMTRTEIRDWFRRHRKTFEIERGLSLLLKQGLARKEEAHTGGRPVERWFAVTRTTI